MSKVQKSKKITTIAVKLSIIVIIMLVISNLVSMILLVNRSRVLIRSTVQNGIMSLADSTADIIENEKKLLGAKDLTYDEYVEILDHKKLQGVESSYVYVVSPDGIMQYHPTKSKVGEPVENEVVKELVQQIEKGVHPASATTEYEFKGVVKYASYVVLDDNSIVVVSADEEDALAGITKITNVSGIILLGICVAAFIISVVFGRSIARPLKRLSNKVQKVAQGNLECDFTDVCHSNDEIRLIRDEMQDMTDTLHDIVGKVRIAGTMVSKNSTELDETSKQTLAANEEISRAVQDVAEGSTNMAGTIADINHNLSEMSEKTQHIDGSVINIKEQTVTVQETSQTMNEKLHGMQKSTEKMDAGISDISDRIMKVNEVVDKVSDIIEVIEGISGQTNLLSLNASIEAARAGDAGKGFAVVAEEIRVLSDNTKSELSNIKDITNALVTECDACVLTSQEVVEDNAKQKEEIMLVINEFSNLDQQINLTAEKAEEIQQQMAQMVKLNEDVSSSSASLADVSSANAAATEEMTANIEELNAMMTGVADMVARMQMQAQELNEILGFFQ